MAPLPAAVGLGFVLGLQHATDPDHLVAVATIVTRERRVAAGALVGVAWGIGHMTMLGLAGSAAVALLVMATLRSIAGAVLYLAVFGFGTIAGMAALTGVMAVPITLALRVRRARSAALGLAAGVASMAFGVWYGVRLF